MSASLAFRIVFSLYEVLDACSGNHNIFTNFLSPAWFACGQTLILVPTVCYLISICVILILILLYAFAYVCQSYCLSVFVLGSVC